MSSRSFAIVASRDATSSTEGCLAVSGVAGAQSVAALISPFWDHWRSPSQGDEARAEYV